MPICLEIVVGYYVGLSACKDDKILLFGMTLRLNHFIAFVMFFLLRIPSLSILLLRVFGFTPSMAAAP